MKNITLIRKERKGYAMVLFLIVLLVLSSMSLVMFISSQSDQRTSVQAREDISLRNTGQETINKFYSRFVSDDSFRELVLRGAFETTEPVTTSTSGKPWLDGVDLTSLDWSGTDENWNIFRSPDEATTVFSTPQIENPDGLDVTTLPQQASSCEDGASNDDLCVKVSTKLDYYSDAIRYLAERGGADNQGNKAATPRLMTITVDIFKEQNGELEQQSRFVQRIRPAQFYDYAFYYQYATLDQGLYPQGVSAAGCSDTYASDRPANCLDAAYITGDVVDGPLFTNDQYVTTCGNPTFSDDVFVAGARLENTNIYKPAFAGCNPNQPDFASGGTVADAPYAAPATLPELEDFNEVAKYVATSYFNSDGSNGATNINTVLSGGTYENGGVYELTDNSLSNPNAEVRYFDVPELKIKSATGSEVKKPISVFVNGSVSVVGDLNADTADKGILGVSSAGTIKIEQLVKDETTGLPVASQCASPEAAEAGEMYAGTQVIKCERHIDAVLVTLNESISTWDSAGSQGSSWSEPRWKTNLNNPSVTPAATAPYELAPNLVFTGAMASKYQGVFGGYNQASSNRLTSGYEKEFTFDARLKDGKISPPFLPSPVSSNWVRIDIAETTF